VNGSSASGLVIDLQRLNSIQVLKNFKLPDNSGKSEPGVISYGPGATWGQIDAVTARSGWVAVGARVSSVGAGGFTTGGGIG
jgi:FAD/FMN-containing dehydrogenase